MHVVYILKVAAEIVFTLDRVTSCSSAVFAASYWTSVACPRLVDVIDMAVKVFGIFERWYITATIALVRFSGDG